MKKKKWNIGNYCYHLKDRAAFFQIKGIAEGTGICKIQQIDNLQGRNSNELVYVVPIDELEHDYLDINRLLKVI
ncbi:MAG: hypothetical protein AAB922_03220 [Patescibacteria group bacterium]